MKYVSSPAARLVLLIFALAFSALPLRADELQDIDALVKKGQHAKALERVNQYLARNPSDAQGRFKKGLILAEQNKVAEAIDVFTKLSQDYPKLPEPHNNLAVLYATQGQYEKARQQLEMSIRTDPRFATAYENLGDVYTKLASQAYDKALQLDSSNSAAKNKLSLIRDLLITSEPRVPAVSIASAGKTSEPVRPPAAKTTMAKAATAQSAEVKPAARQAKSAAAKPAEKAARLEEGDGAAVLQTVLAWANAWSNQKVEIYLAFYAQDFKTPKGEAREQWEAARRQRISAPKKIEVAIESPKVVLKGENDAVINFRQVYRSDSLKTNSKKTLLMVRKEGRWFIQQERTGA